MFSEIEKSWGGVTLDSPEAALRAAARTHIRNGFRVSANVLDTVSELGRACSKGFHAIKDNFIRHDDFLGQWNYVVDGNGFYA